MDNTAILHKKDGFTVRSLGDETLFLDPDGSSVHVADEVGGFIYNLIDGQKSLAEVLQAITDTYEVDEKTAETDLHRFIGDLIAQSILEIN